MCICGDPNCQIAYGLCHCTCGEKAPVSDTTRPGFGWIKGEPKRFVFGHRNRLPFVINKVHKPRTRRSEIVQPKDPSMRYIPLTRGLVSVVDAREFERISQSGLNYYSKKSSTEGCFYAGRTVREEGGRVRTLFLHQEVLPPVDGLVVDHINGDMLDNRRCNLRLVTHQQNAWNRHRHIFNATGFRGVKKLKNGRYAARITIDGRLVAIGYYDTPEEAHAAYLEKELEVRGGFIDTNQQRAQLSRIA